MQYCRRRNVYICMSVLYFVETDWKKQEATTNFQHRGLCHVGVWWSCASCTWWWRLGATNFQQKPHLHCPCGINEIVGTCMPRATNSDGLHVLSYCWYIDMTMKLIMRLILPIAMSACSTSYDFVPKQILYWSYDSVVFCLGWNCFREFCICTSSCASSPRVLSKNCSGCTATRHCIHEQSSPLSWTWAGQLSSWISCGLQHNMLRYIHTHSR